MHIEFSADNKNDKCSWGILIHVLLSMSLLCHVSVAEVTSLTNVMLHATHPLAAV